jgi:hypothetical protein
MLKGNADANIRYTILSLERSRMRRNRIQREVVIQRHNTMQKDVFQRHCTSMRNVQVEIGHE